MGTFNMHQLNKKLYFLNLYLFPYIVKKIYLKSEKYIIKYLSTSLNSQLRLVKKKKKFYYLSVNLQIRFIKR